MDLHDQRYLTCITYAQLQPGIPSVEHDVHTGWSFLDALNHLFLVPPDVFVKDVALAQGHRQYITGASIIDLVDGMPILETINLPKGNRALEDEAVGLLVTLYGQALLPVIGQRPIDEEKGDLIIPLMVKKEGKDFVTPTDKYYKLSDQLHDNLYDAAVPLTPQAYLSSYKGIRLDDARVDGDKMIYPQVLSHHLFATAPEAIMHFLTQHPDKFDRNAAYQQNFPEYFTAGSIARNGEQHKNDIANSAKVLQFGDADGEQRFFSMFLLFRQDVLPTLEEIGFAPAVLKQDSDGYLLEFLKMEKGRLVHAPDTEKILKQHASNPIVSQVYPFSSTLKITDRAIAIGPQQNDKSHDVHYHVYTGDFSVALQMIISHTFNRLLGPNSVIDGQPRWGIDGQISDQYGNPLLVIADKGKDALFKHAGIYVGVSQAETMKSLLDPQWAVLLSQGNKGNNVTIGDLHYEMVTRLNEGIMAPTLGMLKFNAIAGGNFLATQAIQRPELSLRRNEMVDAEDKYALRYDWELTFGNGQPARSLTSFTGMGDGHVTALILMHAIPKEYFVDTQVGKQDIQIRLTDMHFVRTEDMKTLISKGKYDPVKQGFEFGGDPATMEAGLRSDYYILKKIYKKAPHRLAPEPPFQNRRPRRPGDDNGDKQTPSQGI
jgi:hypothetical protein